MKLSVIGAGYVGLTTAACLAQVGHDVFCSESDVEKLSKLRHGVMPLFEPHLEDVIAAVRKIGRLRFGSRKRQLLGETRSSFVWERRHWPMVTRTCLPSKESLDRLQSVRQGIG